MIERTEKPHPFGRLRKSGGVPGRLLGGGWFGKTDWVYGRVLGVREDQIGAERVGLIPENCRMKDGRIRAEAKVSWLQDTDPRELNMVVEDSELHEFQFPFWHLAAL